MVILTVLFNGTYSRDIYYQDPEFFGSQHVLDGIVDNISCMLHVPRWSLHVVRIVKDSFSSN